LEENIRAAVTEAIPRMVSSDDARIRAEEEKTRAAVVAAGSGAGAQQPLVKAAGYGRNDFVTIRKGAETKQLKYKKAEPLFADGWELVL